MPRYVDSHCHLNADYGEKTVAELLREAKLAGVEKIVVPATERKSSSDVRRISEEHDGVFHAVGIHPHDAKSFSDDDLDFYRTAAKHPKCVAIGEIGLDYHYDFSPQTTQRPVFEKLLTLAAELGKPVIIHSREAENDVLPLLEKYATASPLTEKGVLHCFSGSAALGQRCVDLGFLISFSGIVTFTNARRIHEFAKMFPLDRLLIETDAPYLAPLPFRGRRCEPSMVAITAAKIAELRQISIDELADATTANANRLFGLA